MNTSIQSGTTDTTTTTTEYISLKCDCCGGPFHPATGGYRSPTFKACGPCEKNFAKWVSAQTKRKWGGQRFYDHALTSREKTPKEK